MGHFSANFQWRRVPFHWEDSKKGPCAYFQILASGHIFIFPYRKFFFQICIIFREELLVGFGTPFGEDVSSEVINFHLGDPLEEATLFIISYLPHSPDLYVAVNLQP